MSTAQIIQLAENDREFTKYFAGALIQAFQLTDADKLRVEIERMEPTAEMRAELPGMDAAKLQDALILLRFSSYIERLSADGLPKMVQASWLDFTTTVIECLPDRERGAVWDYLDANPNVGAKIRDWLTPNLEKLSWAYKQQQNGGLPPLESVPA